MKKIVKAQKVKLIGVLKRHFHKCSLANAEAQTQETKVSNYTPVSIPNYDWVGSDKSVINEAPGGVVKKNGTYKYESGSSSVDSLRFNAFGVQMISENLFNQLFGGLEKKFEGCNVEECLMTLKKYGLLNTQEPLADVNLNLPPLQGKDLKEHFYNISLKQSIEYKNLLSSLLTSLPPQPTEWVFQGGWTRYSNGGFQKVDYPLENVFVFDVEVCCSEGQLPTLATAVSDKAWYGWVSQNLVEGSNNIRNQHYTIDQLIPLESGPRDRGSMQSFTNARVVVGHNVSYDRARVKEQYWLERTGLRFVDTLSLHVCISGITSYQKALLKAGLAEDDWSKLSSLNSLSKVHELYCGTEISKEKQSIFINGSLKDVAEHFQNLMSYCANDVIATHSVFKVLLPMFFSRFPHPATLAGMLELQSAYIPVNSNWHRYLTESQQAYEDLDLEAKSLLSKSADEACKLEHDSSYKKDLWLWDQDWSSKCLLPKKNSAKRISGTLLELDNSEKEQYEDITDALNNALLSRFSSLLNTTHKLPTKAVHLPGYPAWYRKLCSKPISHDWTPGPDLISTGMQIAPKLLQLTWNGMPLHYVRGSGWGFIVPHTTDIVLENKVPVPFKELVHHCKVNGLVCDCPSQKTEIELDRNDKIKLMCSRKHKKKENQYQNQFCKIEMDEHCGFIKLPHKDGGHLNVGNPLARDFIYKFSDNGLSGSRLFAQRIIEISRMLSYWRNNRERIEKQLVCWLNKRDIPKYGGTKSTLGAILPQLIVCGTLTRRAVEPTWMTASNAIVERVGSELRGIVQAPPGFSFVGADVDSQELWIAALLGDCYLARLHGASPFGWMTINGQKSNSTDMHSVTAKAVGISRNQAKILNYARIYGAGQKFSERLLKQFNPGMTDKEAQTKASAMFKMTKGTKNFCLKEGILPDVKERSFSKEGAKEMCTLYKKAFEELFNPPKWTGGTESAMFNCLEEIARMPSPETPFLKSKLSRALEPKIDQDDRHIPTRINWVVQSGAVDFLHLMLVSMRWLLGPTARFSLSFHDEVRYLVPSEYKYEAALALHVTNLLTRAFCVSQLGMTDLPQSIAFFSSVEIDEVLRKEAHDENKTPSNPHGLRKGYGVPLGESLDIYKSIEKAKGAIGIPGLKSTNIKKKKVCS